MLLTGICAVYTFHCLQTLVECLPIETLYTHVDEPEWSSEVWEVKRMNVLLFLRTEAPSLASMGTSSPSHV